MKDHLCNVQENGITALSRREAVSINNLLFFLEIYHSLCGHLSKICTLCLESKPSLSEVVVEVCASFISNQHRETAEKKSDLMFSL